MRDQRRASNRFGKIYQYARERVKLEQLEPGDHVTYERGVFYWHHMIVESTDLRGKKINVIHYSNNKVVASGKKSSVRRETIPFGSKKFYRIVYHNKEKCFPPLKVVERAIQKLGETCYNICRNNCEHFATECKTGTPECLQAWTLLEITGKGATVGLFSNLDQLKEIFEFNWTEAVKKVPGLLKSLGGRCMEFLRKAWSFFVEVCQNPGIYWVDLKSTIQSIVECFVDALVEAWKHGLLNIVRLGFKKFKTTSKNKCAVSKCGFLIAVVCEVVMVYSDLSEAFRRKNAGEITKRDYQEAVVKRCTSAVCSIPMALGGCALGQILIPIPVLGGVVGGIAGDYCGKLAAGCALSPVLIEGLSYVKLLS